MTVHRMAAKRDRNEQEIVAALRAAGYSVQQLSARGVPDLLVGAGGVNILLEVKDGPSAKLTAAEAEWHEAWQGQVAVVRDAATALQVVADALAAAQMPPALAAHMAALEREANDIRQMAAEDVADAMREADEARAEAISLAHECEALRRELALQTASAQPGTWTLGKLEDEIARVAQEVQRALWLGHIVDRRCDGNIVQVTTLPPDGAAGAATAFQIVQHGVLVYAVGAVRYCPVRLSASEVAQRLDRALLDAQGALK